MNLHIGNCFSISVGACRGDITGLQGSAFSLLKHARANLRKQELNNSSSTESKVEGKKRFSSIEKTG